MFILPLSSTWPLGAAAAHPMFHDALLLTLDRALSSTLRIGEQAHLSGEHAR